MGHDAVIFDLDGVLLDSASDKFRWANRPTQQKAEELGYSVTGRVEPFLFTVNSYEELEERIAESRFSIEEYIQIEAAVAERKVEMVKKGELKLFSASKDVLERLEVPKSVVSNAYGEAVDRIISYLGLDSYLEFWTAPRLDEIERYHSIWKPEAHMLEEAMDVMKSSNPIMVGDSGFDIKAAENTGIDSVLVEKSHNQGLDVNPTHRVKELNELLEIV